MKSKLIIFVLLSISITASYNATCQFLEINTSYKINNFSGDKIHINWSADGNKLLIENIVNGQSKLAIFDLFVDTLIIYSNDTLNFKHPVWHPTDNYVVVFDDSNKEKQSLYTLNLDNSEIGLLFHRSIDSYWPSFTKSGRLVFFTGYNKIEKKWEIYSYDFVYDNLNEVSDIRFNCKNPVVSSDGKLILFQKSDPFNNSTELFSMNWYGENVKNLVDEHCYEYSWDPAGLKFYFTTKDEQGIIQLYSVWKNGTNREQLTNSKFDISSPAVSPDGSFIALTVNSEAGCDVYIIPFDEY